MVNSQGCLEYDVGVCLSPSDINSEPNTGLSSQSFGAVLGSFVPLPGNHPAGLAHDGNGSLYITDLFPGTVYLTDIGGTPIEIFVYGAEDYTGFAQGITTDGSYLYLADSGGDDVDIYTLEGVYTSSFSVAAQTTFPEDITYNPFTGNLYVVDGDDIDGDNVFEYALPTGALVNTFPLPSISTDGITFDPTRCTYWVYDSNSNTITHYDPVFNILEQFPGIENGEGLTVIDDVLYIAAFVSGAIVSFDLTGANNSFADTCNVSTIDLTAQKSNDINGIGAVGIPFSWTINVTNIGLTNATFDVGEVLLQDVLPNGPNYDPPISGNFSGIIGSNFIDCGIESNILTCTLSDGPVTISSNGGFDVVFNVTPLGPGILDNPAQGGICQVDPNNLIAETDEDNNNCTDSIIIEEEPTAIDLASFEVEASDGQAIIIWETATEIDNAGFNIYRATSPDGPWIQVNSALIAAQGDPISGAYYTFIDTPGRGTFYYRLQDIDFFGISTLHQPVFVEMGAVLRIPWYRPSLPEF